MGPRHSRRQTPHADLRHRPQHVGVTAFPSAMRKASMCRSVSVCVLICELLKYVGDNAQQVVLISKKDDLGDAESF